MLNGFISLHRSIMLDPLWQEKPFDRARAWAHMLMIAAHQDYVAILGNTRVELKRGDILTSERRLMDVFGWSKTKVRSFLNYLEADSKVIQKRDHKKTVISICQYDYYQTPENHKKTSKEPVKDHKKTSAGVSPYSKNNINNINNNIIYNSENASFDPMRNIPAFINPNDWQEWVDYRCEIKKPITARSMAQHVNVLEKSKALGYEPSEIIGKSIGSNYTGLFAPNRPKLTAVGGQQKQPAPERNHGKRIDIEGEI